MYVNLEAMIVHPSKERTLRIIHFVLKGSGKSDKDSLRLGKTECQKGARSQRNSSKRRNKITMTMRACRAMNGMHFLESKETAFLQ